MIPEMILGIPTAAAIGGAASIGLAAANVCLSSSIKNDIKKLTTSTDAIKKSMLTEAYLDKMTRDIKATVHTDNSYLSKQIQCAALGIPVQPNYSNGSIMAIDPQQVRCEIGLIPQQQYGYGYNGYTTPSYMAPQLQQIPQLQQTQISQQPQQTNDNRELINTLNNLISTMQQNQQNQPPQMPTIQAPVVLPQPAQPQITVTDEQLNQIISGVCARMQQNNGNGSGNGSV